MERIIIPDSETSYLLDRFIDLYNKSANINDLVEINSEEYKAFRTCTGLPIKLVDVKKLMYSLPVYPPFFKFYSENDYIWLIPCHIPANEEGKYRICGFVLRSYFGNTEKKYMNFHVENCFPNIYGLHDFRDFEKDTPIVVTEGVKDALLLKKYYKYTISSLTNSLNINIIRMLRCFTNKFVIAYDFDARGKTGTTKLKKVLSREDCQVTSIISFYSGMKDWGEFFTRGLEAEREREHISKLLMGAGCTLTS